MRVSTILSLAATALAALIFCPTVHAEPPAPQAAAGLWTYVHPDTQLLAGVDWRRARNSATGRMLARQLAEQAPSLASSGPAMAILDHFDRLLLSTTGRAATEEGQQPPVVVAVEGRLDRASVRKLMPAGTAVERFHGVDLFVPPKGRDTDLLLAVVSERIALIGDRESLAGILDAPTGARDPALLARANELAAECEIWVVSAVSPGVAAGRALPAMKQMDDIESLDLGISLAKGFGLRANLRAHAEESAKGLATFAQLVSSMAAQSPGRSPELTAMLKSLDITTRGNAVRIAMDVPLAQLEKGVVAVKSSATEAGKRSLESLLGMGPATLASAAAPKTPIAVAVAQPPPPVRRTIRIVGLEGGPKEISYDK